MFEFCTRRRRLPPEARNAINTHYISYNSLVYTIQRKKNTDALIVSFVSFVIYLALLLVVVKTVHDPPAHFQFREGPRKILLEKEFPSVSDAGYHMTFMDIRTEDDFWAWFTLIYKPNVLDTTDKIFAGRHNILWGSHFRVIRAPDGGSCSVPTLMSTTRSVSECFYKSQYDSCLLYGSGIYRTQTDQSSLSSSSYRGFFRSYGSKGYVQPLYIGGANQTVTQPSGLSASDNFTECATATQTVDVTTSSLVTNYMQPYILQSATLNAASEARAAFVSFYTYCANLNLFGKTTFALEITPAGSYEPGIQIHTGKLIRTSVTDDMLALMFAIVLLTVSSLWLLHIFYRHCRRGFSGALDPIQSWGHLVCTIYDIIMLVLNITSMSLVVYVYTDSSTADAVEGAIEAGTLADFPSDFSDALVRTSYTNDLMSFSVILSILRLCSYASLSDGVNVILKTFQHAILTGLSVIVIGVFLLVSFVFVKRGLLGAHHKEYTNFETSFAVTIIQHFAPLDSVKYSDIHTTSGKIGLSIVLLDLFVFNVFLWDFLAAIFVGAYIYERNRHVEIDPNISIGLRTLREMGSLRHRLWYSVKTIFTKCCRLRLGEEEILHKLAMWKELNIEENRIARTNYIDIAALQEILLRERYHFQATELFIMGSESLMSSESVDRLRVHGEPTENAPTRLVSSADLDIGELKYFQKQFAATELEQEETIAGLERKIKKLLGEQRSVVASLRRHAAAIRPGDSA
eukprot:g562.t1